MANWYPYKWLTLLALGAGLCSCQGASYEGSSSVKDSGQSPGTTTSLDSDTGVATASTEDEVDSTFDSANSPVSVGGAFLTCHKNRDQLLARRSIGCRLEDEQGRKVSSGERRVDLNVLSGGADTGATFRAAPSTSAFHWMASVPDTMTSLAVQAIVDDGAAVNVPLTRTKETIPPVLVDRKITLDGWCVGFNNNVHFVIMDCNTTDPVQTVTSSLELAAVTLNPGTGVTGKAYQLRLGGRCLRPDPETQFWQFYSCPTNPAAAAYRESVLTLTAVGDGWQLRPLDGGGECLRAGSATSGYPILPGDCTGARSVFALEFGLH